MKLLVLGAARHQMPAIEAALAAGLTVITADNRPTNPGHSLAHACHIANAADPVEILQLARSLGVHGVLGYASEVCARTAARVTDELGLPGPGWQAVEKMSHKDRFRRCLEDAGIQSLPWRAFTADQQDDATDWAESLAMRVVVKPVDNSGGRGITILPVDFARAFQMAHDYSWDGRVIVEKHIERTGSQIGGDAWVENGRLKFLHCFDNDTLPPPANGAAIRETFPATHSDADLVKLREALDRIVRVVGYTHGPINFDACFTANSEPFVFEIAPRNGGNFIPLMIHCRTGVDLTAAAVAASVDPEFTLPIPEAAPSGYNAIWIMHADADGIFDSHQIDPVLMPDVLACHEYVTRGEAVRRFTAAGDATGILHLGFSTRAAMDNVLADMPDLCKVRLLPV